MTTHIGRSAGPTTTTPLNQVAVHFFALLAVEVFQDVDGVFCLAVHRTGGSDVPHTRRTSLG